MNPSKSARDEMAIGPSGPSIAFSRGRIWPTEILRSREILAFDWQMSICVEVGHYDVRP